MVKITVAPSARRLKLFSYMHKNLHYINSYQARTILTCFKIMVTIENILYASNSNEVEAEKQSF